MVKRELTKSANGRHDLCRTFSGENMRLRQKETGETLGYEAIDIIEGFDKEGKPFSRFTYEETDEKSEDSA